MCPEVVGPVVVERSVDVEVLELGEGEEGRCRDDIDAEDLG